MARISFNVTMQSPHNKWRQDKSSINKYEITRQILSELNSQGEKCLRERREVLKRIVEFETFSSCWPNDQLKARGLVAEIQKVVNVKDSFTRINQERQTSINKLKTKNEEERLKEVDHQEKFQNVKDNLGGLFLESNPQRRGKKLETVLNDIFTVYGISVREAFELTGSNSEGIVEQIDGVVEFDGHLYFVEMKWWKDPIGRAEISEHLVRIYHRSEGRAIIISASEFTEPAITLCKEALVQKVVVLCSLQEFVMLLEHKSDLLKLLQKKTHAAIIDKNPYIKILEKI